MSDNELGSSWIYIVLIIVIAVISGLKKSKKSTEPTRIPMSRSEESSEYPLDWSKEIDNGEGYINPECIQENIEKKQEKNIGSLQKNLSIDKEMEERRDDLKEEFDLRKAIIYSEILNRKY